MLNQSLRLTLALVLGLNALPAVAKKPSRYFQVTATGTPINLSVVACLNAEIQVGC